MVRAAHVLAAVSLLSAWVACSDDEGSEPSAPTDVGADTTEDASADTSGAEVDTGIGDEDRGGDEADTGPLEACPGSVSCFDRELERPRAALCTQAGFPTGTACERTEDESDACCVPPFACETNADCEAARDDEELCLDERYPCVCNVTDGSCNSFVCAADSECESDEVCFGGTCTELGDTEGLVARIVSPPGVIRQGESRQLVAVGIDPSDPERVFFDVPITWQSDATDSVAVATDGTATGGASTGLAVIRASVTDNDADPGDTVTLHNYADSDAALRVIAVDESTALPVEGATVWVQPDGAEPVSMTTSATGEAAFAGPLASPRSVSVFEAGHAYVTFVDTQQEQDDLLFALPPIAFAAVVPEEEREGEEGECVELETETLCFDLEGVAAVLGVPDFTVVPNPGEFEVAITGFSLGNSLLDLNFELIVGPNIKRDLSQGPIPVGDLAEIPGGVTMAFNRDPFIPSYIATSLPGERTMWTLGGRVSLSDNPTLLPDIIEQIEGNIEIGQIIAIVLPLFQSFYSGIQNDVTLAIEEGGDLPLFELDTRLSVPVGRRIFIDPPLIPEPADGPLETGIFLAGAMIPSQGFVPLGITAAVDDGGGTELDGVLDGDTETAAIDLIPMNMAPIHGGIDAPQTHYVLVSVALGLREPPGGQPRRENVTGIITRVPPGEPLPNTLELTQDSFAELPDGSSYNPETRTITLVENAASPADFYRVLFKSQRARDWQVHLPAGVTSYNVPDLTADIEGWEDRTQRLRVSVISVMLTGGDTGATFDELLTPEGISFLGLVNVVSEFSVLEIGE